MTSQPLPTRREFSVANEYRYDRRGPMRWILSHALRYKGFVASFLVASTLTAALFSLIPTLTGRAFTEVLKPSPDPNQLLLIGLAILGTVLLRGVTDIVNAFPSKHWRSARSATHAKSCISACWARVKRSTIASGSAISWREPVTMYVNSTRCSILGWR